MMARALFTREQVVQLLDSNDSDAEDPQDDGLDDVFPGSDDDLGFLKEVMKSVFFKIQSQKIDLAKTLLYSSNSDVEDGPLPGSVPGPLHGPDRYIYKVVIR